MACAALAGAAQTPSPAFDIVIRGGTAIDGTGAARYAADVAIAGGAVARVGDLGDARGTVEIDATGHFVTPGFINIHSHATPVGLTTAVNMLTQGVTTEILNADGAGPLDLEAQLGALTADGLAVNAGVNIGFNSIWAEVVGQSARGATPDEIARMRALVVRGLEAGAWGVSAGLDYKPGYYAPTEDVIQIVEAARPWRTVFTNHDRVTPESNYSSLAGMSETIAIGARAGLIPLITHMKVQGHEQGQGDTILGRMRDATARGTYTAADVYPYLAGQTGLVSLTIPGWAQDGGREAMLKRFADPGLRARIVAETEAAMTARFGGADGVYLPATKQELAAVAREWQVGAGEAVVRLLERGSPGIIARFGREDDLVRILQHPTASVACDCGAVAGEASHPRYYGSFPRVLGRYVREQRALTWEDAIRKMTGLPAATVGMVDRGLLAPGMAADIVVFDPATVLDHATFEQPTRPSVGIRDVLVNGRIALRSGAPVGARAGRALRRQAGMPSRPMNGEEARQMRRQSRAGDQTVSLEVTQAAGARRAQGRVRVSGPSGTSIELTTFGVLQTAPRWASVTGWGRVAPGRPDGAATVVLDGDEVTILAGEVVFSTRVARR
jgi:N-acyl-D-amino-acid deacylase